MIIRAKWIKDCINYVKSEGDFSGSPSPYFRKEFSLSKRVKRARLFYSAIGVLKVYVNGNPIDNDYMSPGFTDYEKRIPVLEKDITELIKENNAIGIVAGDGWAVGYMGNNMRRCSFNDSVYVLAQLEIEYENGLDKDIIVTNTDWRVAHGEILKTDNYMGECVDKRLALGDFSVFGYDDSAWNYALTVPFQDEWLRLTDLSEVPPIRVKKRSKLNICIKTQAAIWFSI